MYCVTSYSLTRACSVFWIPGVAIQAKNNSDRVVMLLCCEKGRRVSGCMYLYVLWRYSLMIVLLLIDIEIQSIVFFKMKKPLQAPSKS